LLRLFRVDPEGRGMDDEAPEMRMPDAPSPPPPQNNAKARWQVIKASMPEEPAHAMIWANVITSAKSAAAMARAAQEAAQVPPAIAAEQQRMQQQQQQQQSQQFSHQHQRT
jgi:hypothetical protein